MIEIAGMEPNKVAGRHSTNAKLRLCIGLLPLVAAVCDFMNRLIHIRKADMFKKIFPSGFIALMVLTGCQSGDNPASNDRDASAQGDTPKKEVFWDPGKDPKNLAMSEPENDSSAIPVDSSALPALEKAGSRALPKIASNIPYMVLYSNLDYTGNWVLVLQDADLNDLRYLTQATTGNMNDYTTSIELFNGATAWVCMDLQWAGNCYKVTSNVPDLRVFQNNGQTVNINDRITSVKWREFGNGRYVRVWADPDYAGNSVDLYYPFDYNIIPGGLNDRMTSFINYAHGQGYYPDHWPTPYFYQHPQWTSTITPYSYSVSANQHEPMLSPLIPSWWNDQISSMIWSGSRH